MPFSFTLRLWGKRQHLESNQKPLEKLAFLADLVLQCYTLPNNSGNGITKPKT